jgi:hypothetical protein
MAQLSGRVVICGTEGTDAETVALATAGALFDWARGAWGPLAVELYDENDRLIDTVAVDPAAFRATAAQETDHAHL